MADAKQKETESGRYAYEGLERVLHEKARLGILTALVTHREGLLFTRLRDLCSLSDGNLSRHLQSLEEAGLVEVWKGFRGRKPQTLYRISESGVSRFNDYLEELEKVISDAAMASKQEISMVEDSANGWAPT